MLRRIRLLLIAAAGIVCLLTAVVFPTAAFAKTTPDEALHPELSQHLWSWLELHLTELYDGAGRPARLDSQFFSKMIDMMENDGFIFSEMDKAIFTDSPYPESQLPRWSMHYFCAALIGPYIDWSIQEQYAFFSLMRRVGMIADDFGYPPADPQLTDETPSSVYQAAKRLAQDTYGYSDDELSRYDVLIEFQAFRHPSEPPHERWSVLWCSYQDRIEEYFLVVTYTSQEDSWRIAGFD